MANEFIIKNGFFSQGTSNVTGNLSVSQTISGTTGQFTNITGSLFGTASYASNGGVTQIIAGTNITISPTNGLGAVTINSTGGGPGGTPGGTDTTIQFNSGSTFSGSTNLIYNYNTNTLSGTTAQFTQISASIITASIELYSTDIYGGYISGGYIDADTFLGANYLGNASGLSKVTASAIREIDESFNSTNLSIGSISDGQYLKRVGNTIIGVFITTSTFMIYYEPIDVAFSLGNSGDDIASIEVASGTAV